MGERMPSRRRWPIRTVRVVAWGSTAAAFLGVLGALGFAPKPATAGTPPRPGEHHAVKRRAVRRTVVVRREAVRSPVSFAGSQALMSSFGGGSDSTPAPSTGAS